MAKWTEERRKKQAERIRQNKPWEKSTGPRTEAGKKRSCLNALKHGKRSRAGIRVRQHNSRMCEINRMFIKACLDTFEALDHKTRVTKELIKKYEESKD